MSIIKELNDRGLIHNCTDLVSLAELAGSGATLSVYAGFDCTADSLHVGSLLTLSILKRFQDAGHNVIVVLGTGTSLVGDPSGKDSARPLMDSDTIDLNAAGIIFSIQSVLGRNINVFRNDQWLANKTFAQALRDVGRHMSINKMLAMDSVKTRLEQDSMTFLEFAYSLLQADDFRMIATMTDSKAALDAMMKRVTKKDETAKAPLLFPNLIQIGGSDQWGNICAGLELIRKTSDVESVFGLTHPLLLNNDGTKMGKTVKGAVWLNRDKLSDFDFWQFWRNVKDEDLQSLIKKFTDISFKGATSPNINDVKISLANFMTTMVRGEEAATRSHNAAIAAFSGDANSDDIPSVTITEEDFGKEWIEITVRGGLCSSKSDAKRLCRQGGITIDGDLLDEKAIVSNIGGSVVLRKGKKNILIVKQA